jgi:ATP-dependent helicase/nuclease subunit B
MPAVKSSLIQKHPWGWDRSVLEQAVAFLTQDWNPAAGALDLAETLIIVPTSEAGRRLKEALARATDKHERGASVPWVWTPEQALSPPQVRQKSASRLQSQMAWQQVLQKVPMVQLPALFPAGQMEQNWLWQVEMARLLLDLKATLGAGGLTFGEAESLVAHDAARWRDLALLESIYHDELTAAELKDAQAAKRAVAEQPVLPEGIVRVVILPSPDLPPLLNCWARACSERYGLPVTVALHVPEKYVDHFDELGRPSPTHWGEDAEVLMPFGVEAIHLCHDATAQAERTLDLIHQEAPRGRVAIGIGDPEVGAVLIEKLRLDGVRVFEPSGAPPTRVGLWHVLQQMQTLLTTDSWRAFTTLLRVPEVRDALAAKAGLGLLAEADELSVNHMPVTLTHAQELLRLHAGRSDEDKTPSLPGAVAEMQRLLKSMQNLPLVEAARAWLMRLYAGQQFDPNHPQDHLTTSLGDLWLGFCEQIQSESERFGLKASTGEMLALSLQLLRDQSLTEARGEVDLVLQGWLELLWEPAPHLIVAGVNEEHIPGILLSHPFLPDSIRQKLGLPCQATRFARDAYLMRTIAEQRLPNQGSLHILAGQWSERGDALRPSRLLLLCADQDLPARVTHLFPKEEQAAGQGAEPPRSLAWKLRTPLVAPKVETISPSRLRSYLSCPFRDYLSQQLRMESVDTSKRELATTEFGTLAHHAFQQLFMDSSMKQSVKVAEIEEFLIEAARTEMHRLYGRRPAPLISIQFETLTQNLRYAAETEAAQRKDGWHILLAEEVFGDEKDATPLLIEGARLRCKIDRVDRHERSGHIRVLDYKTSDKARSPLEAHVTKIGPRKKLAEEDQWKTFQHSHGETYLWTDLQLPLYAAALRLRGLEPQSVGYFALPKSVQETSVLLWDDFGDDWIDGGLQCAAEIVRRLRDGQFWPPARKAWEHGYDELFLGDIAASFEFR